MIFTIISGVGIFILFLVIMAVTTDTYPNRNGGLVSKSVPIQRKTILDEFKLDTHTFKAKFYYANSLKGTISHVGNIGTTHNYNLELIDDHGNCLNVNHSFVSPTVSQIEQLEQFRYPVPLEILTCYGGYTLSIVP